MALLQNLLAFYFRGEDYGSGSGNTRELTTTVQTAATQRPVIQVQGFSGGTTSASFINTPGVVAANTQVRAITNRNSKYYLTLICTVNPPAASGSPTVFNIAIAPLQTVFLPNSVTPAGGSIVFNSTWPVPAPVGGFSTAQQPYNPAASSQTLSFDWFQQR